MKLIQELMGRRQFLATAGIASTSALALKKLAGVVDPLFEPEVAMASEIPESTNQDGCYSDRYAHLFSPLRIGNVVIKNRMIQTPSIPRFDILRSACNPNFQRRKGE